MLIDSIFLISGVANSSIFNIHYGSVRIAGAQIVSHYRSVYVRIEGIHPIKVYTKMPQYDCIGLD